MKRHKFIVVSHKSGNKIKLILQRQKSVVNEKLNGRQKNLNELREMSKTIEKENLIEHTESTCTENNYVQSFVGHVYLARNLQSPLTLNE